MTALKTIFFLIQCYILVLSFIHAVVLQKNTIFKAASFFFIAVNFLKKYSCYKLHYEKNAKINYFENGVN